ncbi:hypothetical protein C6W10_14885 [Plantactinospora sp. BB1]|nr:hypothetical protein C6W10_14885 [Plantactinospora sp. BB1]
MPVARPVSTSISGKVFAVVAPGGACGRVTGGSPKCPVPDRAEPNRTRWVSIPGALRRSSGFLRLQ